MTSPEEIERQHTLRTAVERYEELRAREVLADSAGTPTTGTLQDVVLVPAGGWVRLRIPFTALPGRSVYHCHIFDHEDAGMMGTIAVS